MLTLRGGNAHPERAGAMGDGSECASWEPEAEASLITKMLWVVSCPPPKIQGSPRLRRQQELLAESARAAGEKPAWNEGGLGHSWDFEMNPKSSDKLKTSTLYPPLRFLFGSCFAVCFQCFPLVFQNFHAPGLSVAPALSISVLLALLNTCYGSPPRNLIIFFPI